MRVKEDDFDSNPGWILCVVDRRPLLETSRLERPSVGSPEELGLLLEMIALFELLPCREDDRTFSESGCTSLDEGTSSEVLCLEWSPWRPAPEVFLLENASTAPENLSRKSCPTVFLSGLSADVPVRPGFPLECRPLELPLI